MRIKGGLIMSSTLYWAPIEKEKGSFDFALKRAIGRWKFGGDGSVWNSEIILKIKDIPALEGMAACGIEEANDLIREINRHGDIKLWLEY